MINKFDTLAEAAKSATRLSDVSTALTTLESLLGDLAHGSVEEASFVADEDDKWRTEGHEWIGKRLRRPVQGQLGQTIGYVKAKVVGWLPAEESDFVDESKSPAPLWHVLWEDGDEEDLEDFEVRSRSLVLTLGAMSTELWCLGGAGRCGTGCAASSSPGTARTFPGNTACGTRPETGTAGSSSWPGPGRWARWRLPCTCWAIGRSTSWRSSPRRRGWRRRSGTTTATFRGRAAAWSAASRARGLPCLPASVSRGPPRATISARTACGSRTGGDP